MTTITDLCPQLQDFLSTTANELAHSTGFIQRQRQMTGAGLVQTLVFGFMAHPSATRNQLHQTAIQAGLNLSVQALDKRLNVRAGNFLRQMLETGLCQVVASEVHRPLLSRFNGVYLTDGSQVAFGPYRLKLAVRLELQSGQLQGSLEEPRTHDARSAVLDTPLPADCLHLGDLGFFNLKRFQQWNARQVHWLSRFKTGTCLYDADGQPLDLLQCLAAAQDTSLHLAVQVGQRERVRAYLVAQRVTPEVYAQRLAHFKQLRRRQHPVSAAKIILAAWTIYLTSVPDLTFEQAHILARTRWQIELLFKLWKSHARLGHARSADPGRQMCEGYARLLAILVGHWTLLVTGWHDLNRSDVQAFQLIQTYAIRLLTVLDNRSHLADVLHDLEHILARTAHLTSRRAHPRAFQLWQYFELAA